MANQNAVLNEALVLFGEVTRKSMAHVLAATPTEHPPVASVANSIQMWERIRFKDSHPIGHIDINIMSRKALPAEPALLLNKNRGCSRYSERKIN